MYRVQNMIGDAIQVLLAISIVIILFVIAFAWYNSETMRATLDASKTKFDVPIYSGIMDLESFKDVRYNTKDKTSANYNSMPMSFNQQAGGEFTYNFWMFTNLDGEYDMPNESVPAVTDGGLTNDDLILFVKGSKKPYTYNRLCAKSTSVASQKQKTDILVKCPLVKLQRGGDVLTVEFNTLSSPEAIHEQSRDVCNEESTDWKYMNSHKLAVTGLRTGPNASNYSGKWYMVTVIIQDTNPSDPIPIRNKCRCRIFVNGTMELDRYVDGSIKGYAEQSVLRNNEGDFYFAPIVTVGSTTTKQVKTPRKVMMADLTYHNYAMEAATITAKFKEGFKKEFAPLTVAPVYDPMAGASVESVSFASDKKQLSAF